ncbi:Uncharacterised protein [BD1-7 clade bacterium]|uniref:Uncharacterized protein n=1 Tax=BD1-7 clade bacterium TaxID=2029982 RepID=A0A5S9MU30_9GAMM|nr:Uncharacterised protein [BD1-7 clade bacterium]CAA0083669.1 Uncharacterised protein [BD1-7 clade bacterium]
MNPDNIPEFIWFSMAQKARLLKFSTQTSTPSEIPEGATASAPSLPEKANDDLQSRQLHNNLMRYFRDTFYKAWNLDHLHLTYTPNDQYNHIDWAHKAADLRSAFNSQPYPESSGLRGKPFVQADLNGDPRSPPEDYYANTRIGEEYGEWFSAKARLQFVVNQNGGVTLFQKMRALNQKALKENQGFPVLLWKVFPEKAILSNSESCVVYLNCSIHYDNVERFLSQHLWPALATDIDERYRPIGLFSIADRPVWGLNIPNENRWNRWFPPSILYGDSACYIISHTLAASFVHAIQGDAQNNSEQRLVERAKSMNRELIQHLWKMPSTAQQAGQPRQPSSESTCTIS